MNMLFREEERRFAAAVSRVAYDNPFAPERIESERVALGDAFSPSGPVWTPDGAHLSTQQFHRERPNVIALRDLSWQTALTLRARLDRHESDLTDAFEAEFAKVPAPFKPKLLDLDLIGCNSQGEAYVCDVTTRVMPPFMTSEISRTGAVRVVDANGTWVLAGGI